MTVVDLAYFDDLIEGVSLESPGLTITEAHVVQFLGISGAAGGSPDFRTTPIPDLLPICLCSGLTWQFDQPVLAVLAFLSCEWRFLQPTFVGDSIRTRSTTLTKRARREGGFVVESRDILNQRGEVLQSGKLTLLVARRPSAEPEGL